MANQDLTNHFNIVIDASSSMKTKAKDVVKVADALVKHLALQSEEMGQETRISLYSFADNVECLVWDTDVLRLPSIADLYKPYGWTALRDAAWKTIEDYRKIPQFYGDHAFVTYILTDGFENVSKLCGTRELSQRLTTLPDNETVAVLVPDKDGVTYATRAGYPAHNIAIWDTEAEDGVGQALGTVKESMDSFMVARKSGVRSSRDIFGMGADVLNRDTVRSNLEAISPSLYMLIPVTPRYDRWEVRDFLADNGVTFSLGNAFYQLAKREQVQPHKQVVVVEKKTGKVYGGPQARQLVGLKDEKVRIGPEDNKEYDLFIQSTAPNRKVDKGTHLLYMK